MNIREAKDEIKKTVEIYLDKNEFGEYTLPVSKQRPVFMLGAPGIGKTEAVRQIAAELDIAFVPCSMTHYTRQGILGRSVAETRDYEGRKAVVSEYTMGRVIAAVYNVMQDSGKKEGILFLDEINCVQETLMPAILLFLQYRILGDQHLPDGWVIITAGSPPLYNNSAKEFDVAAMDRLKRIEITEDFQVWRQYAFRQGIHAAVITFLERNRLCFYSVRPGAKGMQYATARGWEALSDAIRLYEKKGFGADRRLIGQYITDTEIAGRFGLYYERCQRCRADYQIEDMLSGGISEEMIRKFQRAGTEERYCLLALLIDGLGERIRKAEKQENSLQMVDKGLKEISHVIKEEQISVSVLLQAQADAIRKKMRERTAANSIAEKEREEYLTAIRIFDVYRKNPETGDVKKDFDRIRKQFGREVKQQEEQIAEIQSVRETMGSAFRKAWGDSQETEFFILWAGVLTYRAACGKI